MRTITLALVVAFAAATRLTALDAKLDSAAVKPVENKPLIGEIKPIEKPLEIKAPGEEKKDLTLEDLKDDASKSFGGFN
jgi:hypothetical protein